MTLRGNEPVVVISPHLDDAVFGCGALLAGHPGSVVVTVFAGRPQRYETLTSWDERCGFARGDDVMAARRAEDDAALSVLDARPIWLDFLDAHYAPPPAVDTVADALERCIDATGLSEVIVPLGLWHSDHVLTSDASLLVLRRRPDLRWLCYVEPLYRRKPGWMEERLRALGETGVRATPLSWNTRAANKTKRQAVAKYVSQLMGLGNYDDVFAPEGYYSLTLVAVREGARA